MATAIDARHETAVWIPSGGEQLLGIVSRPENRTELGVVLMTGGGWMPSTHRNRMFVDLARELAGIGCTVVRFDYPGVGDSTGETRVFDSMRPHVEAARSAVEVLDELGSTKIVMVGTCYGGRTALAAARHVDHLVGLVLSGVPVDDYGAADKSLAWHLRKAWSKETLKNLPSRYRKYLRIIIRRFGRLIGYGGSIAGDPASRRYLTDLEEALARRIRVLMLEGERDKHHPSFVAALNGRLGTVLASHSDIVSYEAIDGELHGELRLESQSFTHERVVQFVGSLLTPS